MTVGKDASAGPQVMAPVADGSDQVVALRTISAVDAAGNELTSDRIHRLRQG